MAVLQRAQSDITNEARTETVSFPVALTVPAAVHSIIAKARVRKGLAFSKHINQYR
jgi:hypothetical protein